MEIPKLEPSMFRWHSISADSKAVQRLANGTEAWVGIRDENAKGQYDNYLNTTLRVGATMSLSLAKLQEALSMALVNVRFEHPDLACTAIWGQDKNPSLPHIQYEPLASNAEALEWAKGCVTTQISNYGGLDLRLKLSQQRRAKAVAQSAPSVSVILVANAADDQAVLNEGDRVEMLMLFNHIFWDAMGSRDFVGQLQKHLGKILETGGSYKLPEFQWGDEISHLDLPILDACKVNVEALGADFEAVRAEFIDGLMRSGSSWGMPVTNGSGDPRSDWYTFSKIDSEKIIHAVKKHLGPKYTISHLGHAATVLSLLKNNPLPVDAPGDIGLVTPLPVNGRRFLRDEVANHRFGTCQAGAVVEFPSLKTWAPCNDAEDHTAALEKLCKQVKESYDYWLKKEFQLAVGVSKDNFLGALLAS
ncbi:trichothecene 15-O-acetyltransferase [Penicillium herquei]|nr:trichothecene 15-O-acetyltransferase [Penicillium herquei]